MRPRLQSALTALALCAAVLLPASAATASATSAAPLLGAISASSTAPDPTSSPSTPGPVDPGTGETPAMKETRVDFAPYVIGAAVILALAAATLVWRRAKGGPSSKNIRKAGTDS